MKFVAPPDTHLRFRSLTINLIMLVVALPVHLVVGMVTGIAEGVRGYVSDVREVYATFKG